jgi:hypothetical protein
MEGTTTSVADHDRGRTTNAERIAHAEERDRRIIEMLRQGKTARQAGESLDPPLTATDVNIRMTARRRQGWDVPSRCVGNKVDWSLASDLKEEGVSSARIARLFDVHEGTIEYGRINKDKPRRSAIPRGRLRRRR